LRQATYVKERGMERREAHTHTHRLDLFRHWFEQGELAVCPRCAEETLVVIETGESFCLSCEHADVVATARVSRARSAELREEARALNNWAKQQQQRARQIRGSDDAA
jgi:uncharacterized Zn finger protein (UPF0148 family)